MKIQSITAPVCPEVTQSWWTSRWCPHLVAELVAGHSQDNEPLAGVPLVELVHLGVVPGGCTSERRHILNEDNFPLQGGKLKCFPCQ